MRFVAGHHLADAPARGVVQSRVLLERGVDLQEPVVHGGALRVEDHFDGAEPLVQRFKEGAILLACERCRHHTPARETPPARVKVLTNDPTASLRAVIDQWLSRTHVRKGRTWKLVPTAIVELRLTFGFAAVHAIMQVRHAKRSGSHASCIEG